MWRFFRFEGTPQLHDRKGGKDALTIGYFPDPEAAKGTEEYEYLRSFGVSAMKMPVDFYRTIRPRFAVPPGGLGHNEGYALELAQAGLLRGGWTEVQEPGLPNVSRVSRETLGFGDFTDFQKLGAFGVHRLPRIASEVVREPDGDCDRSDTWHWEWFRDDVRSVDWLAFQTVVVRDFHDQYVDAVDKLSPSPFTQEQRDELVALVGPLRTLFTPAHAASKTRSSPK